MLMQDARLRRAAGPFRCALALTALRLVNVRSYRDASLSVPPIPVVLAGANGSGKTNLLEAISLLSPGRGLRGAKLAEIQRQDRPSARDAIVPDGAGAGWTVAATLERDGETWDIGSGMMILEGRAQTPPRRALRLNGAPAQSADLAELIPVLWLTPAMDRLFLEGASERRRFLDRLVFALDPRHARQTASYERAAKDRLRLLRDGIRDEAWLDGLETAMAQSGSQLSAGRARMVDALNAELAARDGEGAFPCAALSLQRGPGEGEPSHLKDALRQSRARDGEAGRTLVGPHLADLLVRHTGKNAEARLCSTGEQKALLISIVLANAWLQKKRTGDTAPILLLDEIAAHLDGHRRTALFEEILALGAQAWLTGTDKELFTPLLPHAACFAIVGGAFVTAD